MSHCFFGLLFANAKDCSKNATTLRFTLHASSSMEPGLTMCTFTQMCTLTTPRRRSPSCGLQFPRFVFQNESYPKFRSLHKTRTVRDSAKFSDSPSAFLHSDVGFQHSISHCVLGRAGIGRHLCYLGPRNADFVRSPRLLPGVSSKGEADTAHPHAT